MKKSEIKVGGRYIAKVSNNLVTVQVIEINKTIKSMFRQTGLHYICLNLKTGRTVIFKSAAKFRWEVVYIKGDKL